MVRQINIAQKKDRISREEALSFEWTYIPVEHSHRLILDQLTLFNMTNLTLIGVKEMTNNGEIIPHEAIESMSKEYLDAL